MSKARGAAGRHMSVEQRKAASEFMKGFWDRSETRRRVSLAMRMGWDDFKSRKTLYERLRLGLSDAARQRGADYD